MDISKTQFQENHVSKSQLHSALPLTFYLTCSKFILVMFLLQTNITKKERHWPRRCTIHQNCTPTKVGASKPRITKPIRNTNAGQEMCHWSLSMPVLATPEKKHSAQACCSRAVKSQPQDTSFRHICGVGWHHAVAIKKKTMLGVSLPRYPSLPMPGYSTNGQSA